MYSHFRCAVHDSEECFCKVSLSNFGGGCSIFFPNSVCVELEKTTKLTKPLITSFAPLMTTIPCIAETDAKLLLNQTGEYFD